MAVRVTAGRITIAATLAAVMGVVSYAVDQRGADQQAMVMFSCWECVSATSCELHEIQPPQSLRASMTASHFSRSSA